MSVFLRGKVWQYDFWVRKKRYQGSVPEAQNKTQARMAEARVRNQIFEGTYCPPNKQLPLLAEWLAGPYLEWAEQNKKSWKDDRTRSEPLAAFFRGKRLDEIAPFDLERYKKKRSQTVTRRGRPLSAASVNHELTVLSGAYSLAIRNGLPVANPVAGVQLLKRDDKRNRILSYTEEARLLAACDKMKRSAIGLIVRVALQTGMRRGDLLKLHWPEVDFRRNLIHILASKAKTGKERFVPMNATVREILLRLRETTYPVYMSAPEKVFPMRGVWDAFSEACRKAKIKDFRFNDLRHTAARRMADAGVDPFTIAAILGHSSVEQTATYANATGESTRRAVAALEGNQAQVPAHFPAREKHGLRAVS